MLDGDSLHASTNEARSLMDWTTPLYLLIALLFVLINGFFVLAEFALVKVRATRIEELARKHDRRAIVAREMVNHLDNYLAATQLGITLASLGLGWIGEPAFAGLVQTIIELPGWWTPTISHSASTVVAFVIITFLHILLGELAPKSLAIRQPEGSTLAIAYPMLWAYRLFYLPMIVLNGTSNLVLKVIGLKTGPAEVVHTAQELRMLLSTVPTTSKFSLNRLLILENVFDLGHQTVKDAMIPWSRLKYLSRSASKEEVLELLIEHRYSRWPVLDAKSGTPTGYLLMKDMLILPVVEQDWGKLIRPVTTVTPNDNLEAIMQRLQRGGSKLAVVVESGRAVGLITLEDILEEVVGRIEDEYPRLPRLFLKDALEAGGVLLDFPAESPEHAIRALAATVDIQKIPPGVDVCALALARERQFSSDVGHGVAIPHARCPSLARPLIVFGRSAEPVVFDENSPGPVRLFFLVVTPAERPNVQVFLLEQLAHLARSEFIRERLIRAQSQQEVFDTIAAADPAVTG